jgi:hypothetical protein
MLAVRGFLRTDFDLPGMGRLGWRTPCSHGPLTVQFGLFWEQPIELVLDPLQRLGDFPNLPPGSEVEERELPGHGLLEHVSHAEHRIEELMERLWHLRRLQSLTSKGIYVVFEFRNGVAPDLKWIRCR